MTTFTTTVASGNNWTTDIVTILRVLIDDPAGSVYSNSRLTDIVVVAGHFVSKEFVLDNEYSIDLSDQSINSDPDENFKNLTALKAAMLVLAAEAKTMAMQGIKIVDGPSSIETGRGLSYIKMLADSAADQYAIAKTTLMAGSGRIILTPFTSQYINIAETFT